MHMGENPSSRRDSCLRPEPGVRDRAEQRRDGQGFDGFRMSGADRAPYGSSWFPCLRREDLSFSCSSPSCRYALVPSGPRNVATIIALFFSVSGLPEGDRCSGSRSDRLCSGGSSPPCSFLAAAGGIASALVMWGIKRAGGNTFGPVGVSVVGAVVHNIVQLAAAYLLFVKSVELFIFIPLFP